MKIFSTSQIREIDRLTIENEPISSISLMERAADAILRWFSENISPNNKIFVFAGNGNNGGDGFALARMLIETGYYVEVFLLESSSLSLDCKANLERIKKQGIVKTHTIKDEVDFPIIESDSIIVDSLFGSGLTRPLAGIASSLIEYINRNGAKVISIDMPSGLFGENNPYPNINPVVKASITLTLQFPKLSFFIPENNQYVGKFIVLPIGLSLHAINTILTSYQYIDIALVAPIVKTRSFFSHKGNYGHCLIIAGSKGMMGAAVLASTSCIKAGSGLVTAHVPRIGYAILQQSIPEAMVDEDLDENHFTSFSSISKYSAIAIGPGLGKSPETISGFLDILKKVQSPLLIDADGLNILANNSRLMDLVPAMTIITPHAGEFDRLFGESNSGNQRLIKAIDKAKKHNVVIVLKGAFTQIVCPDGNVYFNSTGNPGMATAGSGDVLSGIIASLLGQGYAPVQASVLGVFLHGLAGDLAAEKKSMNAITASDIICYLGDAFNLIYNTKDE